MPQHTHTFVEKYDGLVGYGLDRENNENTLIYYLQKFSDDNFMALVRNRMSDNEMDELFNLLGKLIKTHLSDDEYHRCFLKD